MISAAVGVVFRILKGNVPKTEEKDNDKGKANDAACDGSPNHGEGNFSRGVFDFIGHVKDRIVSTNGEDDCQQAYAPLHTLVFPTTLAVEGGFEDKVCRALPRHDDEDHNKYYEAEDVQNCRCDLKRREDPPSVDVAEYG